MKTSFMWVCLTTLLCTGAIQAAEGSSESPAAVPPAGPAGIFASETASHPDDIYWDNSMSLPIPGVNGAVNAAVVYDGKLVIGGDFTVAGDVAANCIAAWDGSSWAQLGDGLCCSGFHGCVYALTVYNGKLIAAGGFSTAGGVDAQYVASWDGTSWSPLGDGIEGSDVVAGALAVYDERLIVGFHGLGPRRDENAAGTGTLSSIMSWDGSSWSPLMGVNYTISALTVYDEKLIVGGYFVTAGGISANGIASWDGNNWGALDVGTNGPVSELTVYDGKLIACGSFMSAGGVAANRIASWDGVRWSALGNGANFPAALAVFDGKLLMADNFRSVLSWDGNNWSPLGLGVGFQVTTLIGFEGRLMACGYENEGSWKNIASWDGTTWSSLGPGTDGGVFTLLAFGGQLIAGGSFTASYTAAATHIASWDGSKWSALGPGVNGPVKTLVMYDEKLIAGGEFITAGGIRANRIAAWDGTAWSPLGTGLTGSVFALAVYNGDLYAGGRFWGAGETEARNIARWDGRNWSAVGEGREGEVRAMVVYRGKLILIESLDPYWPGLNGRLSSWDGTRWEYFPSPDYPPQSYRGTGVQSLAIYGDNLVAGGVRWFSFYECDGDGFVASWDGSKWSDLTDELGGWYCDIQVNALAAFDSKLFVGGRFWPDIGDDYWAPIIAWDGSSWSRLGSGTGVGQDVYCLAPFFGKLVVGGNFTNAGEKLSEFVAQWTKHTPMSVNPVIQDINVDLRPGICPNPLYGQDLSCGKSVIPVAVLGSAEFNVSDIDASSVTMCGVRALEWSLIDVSTPTDKTADSCACSTDGPDGYPDLLLKFDQCAVESAIKPPPPPPTGTGVEVAKLAVGTGDLTATSTTLSDEPAKPPLVLTLHGMLEDGSPIIGYDCLELSDKVTPAITPIDEPESVGLRGNYPNPFNPTTTISYSVPAQTHVVIELFNIVGQRIRTLVDETKPSGVYEVVWNGTNDAGEPVSSGVYLYRLRAGDLIETKKMVLLK